MVLVLESWPFQTLIFKVFFYTKPKIETATFASKALKIVSKTTELLQKNCMFCSKVLKNVISKTTFQCFIVKSLKTQSLGHR